MRAVAVACFFVGCVGSASAFVVPTAPIHASKAAPLKMSALDGMVGAGVETGGKPWDPLGLSAIHETGLGFEAAHPKWLQESEIKHGRMAMLATVGAWMTHAGIHLPGMGYETTDWTTAWGEFAAKNPAGVAQVCAFIALVEGATYPEGMYEGGGRETGNLGYDPLNLSKGKSESQKNEMKLKEIKNGRAAMIAMAALAAHHYLPGSVPLMPYLGW